MTKPKTIRSGVAVAAQRRNSAGPMMPDVGLLQRVHAAGSEGLEVAAGSLDHERAKRMCRPDALFAWILDREERIDAHTRITRSRFSCV